MFCVCCCYHHYYLVLEVCKWFLIIVYRSSLLGIETVTVVENLEIRQMSDVTHANLIKGSNETIHWDVIIEVNIMSICK